MTLTQWIMILGAAIIGILVVLLKIRGSEIHKLQIKLLESNFKDKDLQFQQQSQQAQSQVSATYQKFKSELASYNKARQAKGQTPIN